MCRFCIVIIHRTCIGNWGGVLGSNPDIESTLKAVSSIEDSGIFMEEISNILNQNNLDIPMIDYNKNDLELTINQIKKLI